MRGADSGTLVFDTDINKLREPPRKLSEKQENQQLFHFQV